MLSPIQQSQETYNLKLYNFMNENRPLMSTHLRPLCSRYFSTTWRILERNSPWFAANVSISSEYFKSR